MTHSKDGAIEKDILTSGQLRMKTRTDFKKTGHSSIDTDTSLGRLCNSRNDLK